MDVIERKLTEIYPYEHNPRKNDGAVDYVANSIREFGFKQPIVVDKNGVIIVGHTRYKAAQKLGLETAPVVVADDLDEEKARAYRLADNKTNELADCFPAYPPQTFLRCRPTTAGGLPHSDTLGSKPCRRLPEAYRGPTRP